ncbi:galactose-1-phosphate uridylyltransferase [bacterium]|nr:MAG: galactose-1-phosphate uridylyltransferase [bacterium]
MSEFRQDLVNKNWVLFAESRAKRPDDFKTAEVPLQALPEVAESCVFCPGHENGTGMEIARYPSRGLWQVRVIPNKYEAVGHVLGKRGDDFYLNRPGVGDHEVIISRPHNKPFALQDESLIDLTLQAYIDRVNELKQHDEVRYVHIIQNHGAQAGASVIHPHSQVIAIPFLPERIQAELLGTRSYMLAHGACVYCEMVLYEMQQGERVVIDDPNFLVIAPYASRMPFEIEIIPKSHKASFHEITITERRALARVMKTVFATFYKKMCDPSYNLYLHTVPFGGSIEGKIHDDRKSYHWHMVILPRVNIWAGLELGAEVYVNPMLPESVAKFFQ